MCCPECEDYIDEDGCCSCTPDEEDEDYPDDYPALDALEILTILPEIFYDDWYN